MSKILTDLSSSRNNICFPETEHCKLTQVPIFFLKFLSKAIVCILDGILKLLSLLEGMCDLTSTIKATFLLVLSSQYVNGSPLKLNKPTKLSKSPDLFLMELIFRCEKITLLRWECRKPVKVVLLFSSYSG